MTATHLLDVQITTSTGRETTFRIPADTPPNHIDSLIAKELLLDLTGGHLHGRRWEAHMTNFDPSARCTLMRVITEDGRWVGGSITYSTNHEEDTPA